MSFYENSWPQVGPVAFTADGSTNGYITIASTFGFYAGQQVSITSSGKASAPYEVKEVLSATQLRVGLSTQNTPSTAPPFNYNLPGGDGPAVDVSGYTLAQGSTIFAPKQPRVLKDNALSLAYLGEPVVALRVVNVDGTGNVGSAIAGSPSTFQYARVSQASITSSNANAGTAFPIMTLTRNTKIFEVLNSLNQDCSITLNGVETFRLEAGDKFLLDVGSDGLYMAAGTVVGIYQNGTPPTTGSIRITAIG